MRHEGQPPSEARPPLPSRGRGIPGGRGGLWRRFFAWMHAHNDETSHRIYGARKQALLGDLRGDVLEIGPGTGANLRYFGAGVRWIGLEPNWHMHAYLRREAGRRGIAADLRVGVAEAIDLPSASVATVVGTLVLCSVDDVDATLREIQRVLTPGGRFVFLEHVAAPRGTALRRMQELIRPLWQCCADGCHLDRETWAALESAGFAHLELGHFRAAVPVPLVAPHIAGRATVAG